MKKNWLKLAALIVACAFTLSTQAFADGQDKDQTHLKKQDESCQDISDVASY